MCQPVETFPGGHVWCVTVGADHEEERVALSRKFIDSEGVHWQVYELADEARADDLEGGGWLYFFSRGATRSLSSYPDDWVSMDWPGLERLCHRAEPPVGRERMARRSVLVRGAEA